MSDNTTRSIETYFLPRLCELAEKANTRAEKHGMDGAIRISGFSNDPGKPN